MFKTNISADEEAEAAAADDVVLVSISLVSDEDAAYPRREL